MRALLLLVASGALAAAQPIGAGLKIGGTVTDAVNFKVPGHGGSKNFVVGPYVELRLPAGFSIEGDALYQSGIFSSVASGGSAWQFPIVAKYRFTGGFIRPYVEGGIAYSRITDIKDILELNHRSNFGIVLGGGLEFKLLFLRVSPEIRYNAWVLRNIESPFGFFQSTRNQAAVLVGIGF